MRAIGSKRPPAFICRRPFYFARHITPASHFFLPRIPTFALVFSADSLNNICMSANPKHDDRLIIRERDDIPPEQAEHEQTANHAKRKSVFKQLGSYRAEIIIEILLVVICAILGVAFQLKMMLTVSLICCAAAVPDILTAGLVRKNDPVRKHGKAMMYFFIAMGLLRTAAWGISIFFGAMLMLIFFPQLGGLADVGAITGFIVTMIVSVIIFPITLLGVLHGWSLPGGVFFCRELTTIRRLEHREEYADFDIEALNPANSLKILAIGSSISIAIFSVTLVVLLVTLIFKPQGNGVGEFLIVGIVVAQLLIPIPWYVLFTTKFVEQWPNPNDPLPEVIEPLSPEEIQFL